MGHACHPVSEAVGLGRGTSVCCCLQASGGTLSGDLCSGETDILGFTTEKHSRLSRCEAKLGFLRRVQVRSLSEKHRERLAAKPGVAVSFSRASRADGRFRAPEAFLHKLELSGYGAQEAHRRL